MKPTKRMLEKGQFAAHQFLEELFPNGAPPGGVQLFAKDALDPNFEHEKGCAALARAVLTAALARTNTKSK
jgi:hypothetical protein